MTDPLPQQMQIRGAWALNPGNVPLPVNQFLIQYGPPVVGAVGDGYVLTFGNLQLPVFSPEAAAEVAGGQIPNVVIFPLGQFFFTDDRLKQLRDQLTDAIDKKAAQVAVDSDAIDV
jgi:hypothetical protein